MNIAELKILFALEPSWTVSLNGREFIPLRSSEIDVEDPYLRCGRLTRKVLEAQCLRPNVVRVRARSKFRSQIDVLTFYAGEILPSAAELLKRRRSFQGGLARAVANYYGARISTQTLQSDKQHGIGGAYPRILAGRTHAIIGVDADESAPVVNGIVRAAIQWATIINRRVSAVVPAGRSQTISSRLRAMPSLRAAFDWLEWDGERLQPLQWEVPEVETHVYPCAEPNVGAEVERICSIAPDLLQAVPHIPGRAVSIRLRGLEVARVTEDGATYPLGEPLEPLIEELARVRRVGSRHPLARAHEEAWLESKLIGQIRDVLPVRKDCIYPQVPSFAGDDRKIIDLLAVMDSGRLAVIEIKASADPDLPLQAFDYWLAVERHRKAGDFTSHGYFKGIQLRDEPAVLVMVAPLLSFHRAVDRLTAFLPRELPMMQIGINQGWKKEIKVLRRKGALG